MSRIRIGAPPRRLEAVLTEPTGPARGAAVVCHPHPQMGGDMDNPVVVTVADVLRGVGFAVLRFNFGGVGASEGSYSGGPAEVEDVTRALATIGDRSGARVLAGYSFGAWAALRALHQGAYVDRAIAVAPPLAFLDWSFLPGVEAATLLVAGDRDPYCPAARLSAAAGGSRQVVLLPGVDHFFAGADDALRQAVARAVAG